jgi:hypothetical protein
MWKWWKDKMEGKNPPPRVPSPKVEAPPTPEARAASMTHGLHPEVRDMMTALILGKPKMKIGSTQTKNEE